MPIGIVEELFIATDPTTGLNEVWYRNSNVTQSLVIRSLLNANPESVNWGTWKSEFVVRTGTLATAQQYYTFNLIRVGLTSGADGIGPTAVAHLKRTETPYTSTLPLLMLSARVTVRRDNNYHINSSATYTLPGGIPTYQDGSSSAVQGNREAIGTGSRSVSLLNLIVLGATISSYGLDAVGDLILAVRGTIPDVTINDVPRVSTSPGPASGSLTECASITTTTNDTVTLTSAFKNDTHLWVINHTRLLILMRTTKATPHYESESFDTPAATITGIGAWVIDAPPPLGASGCDSHAQTLASSGTPGSTFSQIMRKRSGTTVLKNDAPWVHFSFIDTPLEHDFQPTDSDAAGGAEFVTPYGAAFSWFANGTLRTSPYTDAANVWRYTVSGVWLLSLYRPMKVVCWIRRTKGSDREDGLFVWSEATERFTAIYAFTAATAASDALATLTGNFRDIIWELDRSSDAAYLQDLETNHQVGMGTNLTTLRDHYFKMLDFRFLYRAAGDQPTTPGYFVSAWNVGGDPVELNMANPAAVSALTPYASLAALPSGVAAPVIARLFRRDVILKDDWDDITSGVISVADDGVGTDVGGPGDPVTRAIILCNPSTAPAAFIARFPGRSDGAEGTPAPLDITASQRVTENTFTSALSSQRYEDEPVVAFVVSAATSVNLLLAQELQSSGLDAFRCIIQPGLQPNPGADTHRAESVELMLRRGPGQSHPGTAIMSVAPVTSNILDNQGGTVGTQKDVPGLGDATSPIKAPIGQLVTGRFLSFNLRGTNVNSVLRYLGSFVRGRRTT